MTDNEYMSPFFKYATLFVLIPTALLLICLFFFDFFQGEMDGESFPSIVGFLAILIVPIFVALYPKKTDKIEKNMKKTLTPIGEKVEQVVLPVIWGFFTLCSCVLLVILSLYGLRWFVRFLIY